MRPMVQSLFAEEAHNGLVLIMFTRPKHDGHTDGTTAALLYPLHSVW